MKWTNTEYATGNGERNDCSVRAYAVAACVSYESAHQLYTKHGRLPGKRTRYMTTTLVLRETFPNATSLSPYISLNRFVAMNPKGHFILHTKSHAFALCDGIVHDWGNHPRYRILEAWKLV